MRIRGLCVSALCTCMWLATSTQVGYAETKGGGEKQGLSPKQAAVAEIAAKESKAAALVPNDDADIDPVTGAPRGASGACCNPFGGQCTIQPNETGCTSLGGEWQGAGTSCDPNPCFQPLDCFSISPNGALISVPPAPLNTIDLSPSDENNSNVATEYFALFSYSYITEIRWWGVYSQGSTACTPNANDFRIRIFADANGPGGGPSSPGARVLCENVVTVTPLHTNEFVNGREIREFTATIPQCALALDGWIEIQKVDDGGSCIFSWVSGDDPGSLDGNTSLLNGQQVNWDLSLCLATSNLDTPTGACCDDDLGTCQEAVQLPFCTGGSARFTADTLCANVTPPCGQVTGACCATFTDPGGTFEEGDCAVVTASECSNMFGGGVWHGAFTDCTPNPCQGACCLGDGTCIEATVNECSAQGGQHFGDGTTCQTTACPGTGRCCYNLGQDCSVVTEAACTAQFGGVFTPDISCQVACPIPPTNDECSSAIDIVCGTNVTVDNTTATENATDPIYSCRAGVADNGFGTIWFTFTATETTALVHTCDSVVGDTLLAVYDGTCGALTEIACGEDDCGLRSQVCAENLIVGNTYYIQASTFGDGGRGAITVQVDCPCPSGGCCTDIGCDIQTPQNCAANGGTYLGDSTVCDAGSCDGACCFADGSCSDLSSGDCAAQGGFFEAVGTNCASTVCPIRPTNERCDIPLVLDPGTDLPYSQVLGFGFATADGPAGSCDGFGATGLMQNDLWWEITPTENCQLRVTVTPAAGFDPIIVIRDSCAPGTELDCSDETVLGDVEQLEFILTAGNTYYIQIGDTGVAAGGDDATVDIICGQVGSCCLPSNACVVNQESDCLALGGSFGGADTDCGFRGACCLPDTCIVTSRDCCLAASGSYVGDGTNCGEAAGNPDVLTSSPALAIPDATVGGATDTINEANSFGIGDVNVSVNITHTWISDLTLSLEHNGVNVVLLDAPCGNFDNLQVTLDDSGGAIVCATPTTGVVMPDNPLSAFNGLDSAGSWNLTVEDGVGGDAGTLNSWSVSIDGLGQSPCDAGTGACCIDTVSCTPDQTVAQCSAAGGTFLGVGSTCEAGACDIRGACCNNITGSCTVESAANCAAGNGTYQGDFTDCSTASCPIILGACCNPDATCTPDLTFDACTGSGGNWQGPSSICSTATGACCFPGAECRIASQECCEAAGGLFQGVGITCGGQTDSGPVGVAIVDNSTVMSTINVAGSGTLMDVNVSLDITHTWIGDLDISLEHNGVTVLLLDSPCGNFDNLQVTVDDDGGAIVCAAPTTGTVAPAQSLSAFNGLDKQGLWNLSITDNAGGDQGTLNNWSLIVRSDGDVNPCQGGTGACCVSESSCLDNQTLEQCDNAGGLYLGIDSVCTPGVCAITGACCNPVTGQCTEVSQLECETLGNLYQGNFTLCINTQCEEVPGACCNADGTCTNGLTFNECTGAGGAWQGASTTCPTINGACCFTGGLCIIASQACCLNAGGAYVGDGTNCGAAAGNPDILTSSPGLAIPDATPAGVTDSINEASSFSVGDVNVSVDITHTWIGDLNVSLEHNGVSVLLLDRPCGNFDNMQLLLDDDGSAIVCATPTTGTAMPDNPLSAFIGLDAAGSWNLTVSDNAGADLGTLNSWTIYIDGVGQSPCDAGTGACCLSPTNCVPDQTLQECSMAGGTYLGLGSTCTAGVCDIMGACCDNITGACTVESETSCDTHGTYSGDFSDCSSVNCPIILGACCNADATCTGNVTFDACEGNGGSWQGPSSVCSTITGACCLPGALCIVTTQDCCEAANGAYVGDGTNCGEAAGNPVTYDSGFLGFAINDNTTTSADVNVPDNGTVGDVDVAVNITHTFLGDLEIDLIHSGVTVRIMQDQCGVNDNMMITFDDEAGSAPVCATPTNGTFTPLNPLSAFDGLDKAGVWTLSVFDDAGGDQGTIDSFQIIADGVGQSPCSPSTCQCPGDVNGDNSVDGLDIQGFSTCLLSGGANCDCADMNNSGSVTMADVPLFVTALLNSTGPCN